MSTATVEADAQATRTSNGVQSHQRGPFTLARGDARGVRASAKRALLRSVERALGLHGLDACYRRILTSGGGGPLPAHAFTTLGLRSLEIDVEAEKADLELVPKTGAAIVVSNHPFGGVDGVALADLLLRVRSDVKILANELLGRIPELRPLLILVDALGGKDAAARNAPRLREALRWLADGHLLVVFPAGEVASLDLRARRVADRAWSPAVCRLAERTGAPIVPAHVVGRNRARFQVAGLVHARLRTALLPRELLAMRGARVEVRFGAPLRLDAPHVRASRRAAIDLLRDRVEWLGARAPRVVADERAHAPQFRLASPLDPGVIARELDALPPQRCVAESGDLRVVWARGDEIPQSLREIGRLRERTFREVGEGTGRALDVDEFDAHYLHLVLWSPAKREIAGAYRCAYTDDVLRERGARGLYTSKLFDYDARFFERLGPALELGRSFVIPERQRQFAPLMLLWKGIGALVLARPSTRTLFGAVSISARYHACSRALIVRWLERQRGARELEPFVEPRTQLSAGAGAAYVERIVESLSDDERDLAAVVGDLEPERRGVPILLREYLQLGGRVAAFNRDAAFADVHDGLVVVDLARVAQRTLARYMGSTAAYEWLATHGANPRVVDAQVVDTQVADARVADARVIATSAVATNAIEAHAMHARATLARRALQPS